MTCGKCKFRIWDHEEATVRDDRIVHIKCAEKIDEAEDELMDGVLREDIR